MPIFTLLILPLSVFAAPFAPFENPNDAITLPHVEKALSREVISARRALTDTQEFCDSRIARLPSFESKEAWEAYATPLRQKVLDRIVFRGVPPQWRNPKPRVEWLATMAGGPGYRIRKLRYEALPGVWIPALLYEPDKLSGRVPAILNVNGHDPKGKAAAYKQARCINLAKRGFLALNTEWLNMGQLRSNNWSHYRMNQLDLCGTSGLSVFFLAMQRGLDVLCDHANVDRARIAVAGLSGGGWQTITLSALDQRVTLCNPVAGYSSFRTRIRHFKDLGDSEQTPCDLAALADYTHLTALLAPRAALLTYNAKDDCCFEAGYALPPLVEAASPVYKLYSRPLALRTHININPGTHNYLIDNRQALYRMLAEFFNQDTHFSTEELQCADEIKDAVDLTVPLPENNGDFHSIALSLAKHLPQLGELPKDKPAAENWQEGKRQRLREIVRWREYTVNADQLALSNQDSLPAKYWRLKLGKDWTIPAVEFAEPNSKDVVIVCADGGRRTSGAAIHELLQQGIRVCAIDPFYLGESRIEQRDLLFALLVNSAGERPLGIQAGQLAAAARWCKSRYPGASVRILALGPRTSTAALVAAALETKAIDRLTVRDSMGSLKEIIESNRAVTEFPELFCFGLLESLDLFGVATLVAPREVHFDRPSARLRTEMAKLRHWYATLGKDHEPLR